MINGIQVIGLIFGLGILYLTYVYRKRGDFTKKEFLVWGLLWFGFVILVIFPSTTNIVLESLNVKRSMDLFTIMGMIGLFGITFYIYDVLRKEQRKSQNIAKQLAHLSAEYEQLSKKNFKRKEKSNKNKR